MYVKLSEPLKKWAQKPLLPLGSFCRPELCSGRNPAGDVYLLGRESGRPLGVHSSDVPLQNLVRAEICLSGLPQSSSFPAGPVLFC